MAAMRRQGNLSLLLCGRNQIIPESGQTSDGFFKVTHIILRIDAQLMCTGTFLGSRWSWSGAVDCCLSLNVQLPSTSAEHQMRTPRHREVKSLAQGHKDSLHRHSHWKPRKKIIKYIPQQKLKSNYSLGDVKYVGTYN